MDESNFWGLAGTLIGAVAAIAGSFVSETLQRIRTHREVLNRRISALREMHAELRFFLPKIKTMEAYLANLLSQVQQSHTCLGLPSFNFDLRSLDACRVELASSLETFSISRRCAECCFELGHVRDKVKAVCDSLGEKEYEVAVEAANLKSLIGLQKSTYVLFNKVSLEVTDDINRQELGKDDLSFYSEVRSLFR